MNFLDLKLKSEYRSLNDDIIWDFFYPTLKQSVLYKRAVGYFSSSGLMALSDCIFELIERFGSIQLIISPQLSEEDLQAIKYGFYRRGKVDFEDSKYYIRGDFDKPRLNLLSNLIATGILKIKIAFLDENNGFGRFNEKMGLMYDSEGNVIAFSGSMNESANAFKKNYDSIDVFTSWTNDKYRVKAKEATFDLLWDNKVYGINVIDFDAEIIKAIDYDEMSKIRTPESFLSKKYQEKISSAKDMAKVIEDMFNDSKNPEKLNTLSTGLYNLDKFIDGLHKGHFIILASRPYMGKTALALNIATSAARKDNVLFFSLEMSKDEILKRILCSLSGVSLRQINSKNLSDDDLYHVSQALEYQKELKLFIDDTTEKTINQIKVKSRTFKIENGLGLIIIDNIQMLQGSKEYRWNKTYEISEIAHTLKALARELNIPIILVSNLNYNVKKSSNTRPQFSDLPGDGSLEGDADLIMFLYKDDDDDFTNDIRDLIIAKNRHGTKGSIKLLFSIECMKFLDITQND